MNADFSGIERRLDELSERSEPLRERPPTDFSRDTLIRTWLNNRRNL
ncbi:MAG: hypothetical protein KatS3mg050_4516 [Litorilinea sp.]|nr:MAG: hypothetical protein KatS3mg050_4516 [Litorilinea sp.]